MPRPTQLLSDRDRRVDSSTLGDDESERAAVTWWEELTGAGGEGMVVKPLSIRSRAARAASSQPAVKCRGREYLRIIYGPEYTLPENLDRLRARGLGAKRSLALREFALGIEALERFVAQRAAVPRARVRVRRARARERTGRPAALTARTVLFEAAPVGPTQLPGRETG